MQLIDSFDLLIQSVRAIQRKKHRAICLLRGSEVNLQQWIEINFPANPKALYFLASDQAYKKYLGFTYERIFFNAYAGFHPDKFCALVDTLAGGGIMFLMIPASFKDWLVFSDPEYQKLTRLEHQHCAPRFLKRLISFFEEDHKAVWALDVNKKGFSTSLSPFLRTTTSTALTISQQLVATVDQNNRMLKILSLLKLDEIKLNLTADRGRGKSCLIALLVAEAFKKETQPGRHWVLTTPHRAQAELIFHYLFYLFDQSDQYFYSPCQLIYQGQTFIYQPIIHFMGFNKQVLLSEEKKIDLLIVDEAAGFPMHELQILSEQFSSILFSTTVKGYEGSGQGFKLQFARYLQDNYKNYHSLFLDKPLRWAFDDPLEAWMNQAFLLGIFLPGESNLKIATSIQKTSMQITSTVRTKCSDLTIRQENRDNLVENRSLLASIYVLLREAHYRTRPSDVRVLLDAPGQYIWAAWKEKKCIGVIWICQDGPLPKPLWGQILEGKRRLKGHLVPQAMGLHAQSNEWLNMRIGRVIRIAVHAGYRRAGVASLLIQAVEQFAQRQAWNALGTSFSGYDVSIKFWEASGFKIAKEGSRKNASTGKRAVIFIKPLRGVVVWA